MEEAAQGTTSQHAGGEYQRMEKIWWVYGGLFLLCVLIFYYIVHYTVTDTTEHIQHIIDINAGDAGYPANFLYYGLANALTGWSSDLSFLRWVTIFLMSVAVVAKLDFTRRIIGFLSNSWQVLASPQVILAASVALLFYFAIPDPYGALYLNKYYLGRLVPSVWHNTTLIVLMPFALWLLLAQLKLMQRAQYSWGELGVILVAIVFNVLIKPSFIFIYLPVTALLLAFIAFRQNSLRPLRGWIPLLLGGIFIIVQYILIYHFEQGSFDEQDSHVALAKPLLVMRKWLPLWYIPVAWLLSLAFPLALLATAKSVRQRLETWYAAGMFAFGLLLSIFVVEQGPRLSHGNFLWQNVVAYYVLLVVVVAAGLHLLNSVSSTSQRRVLTVVGALFGIHVLAGIVYLIKIFLSGTFI